MPNKETSKEEVSKCCKRCHCDEQCSFHEGDICNDEVCPCHQDTKAEECEHQYVKDSKLSQNCFFCGKKMEVNFDIKAMREAAKNTMYYKEAHPKEFPIEEEMKRIKDDLGKRFDAETADQVAAYIQYKFQRILSESLSLARKQERQAVLREVEGKKGKSGPDCSDPYIYECGYDQACEEIINFLKG